MSLNLHLNWKFLKYFLKRCLGSPCYLMVVSGGSSSSGSLNKDTRRCFLHCLQVSSSSSLLFNIKFWSAVRITSFSVRHRSHALFVYNKIGGLILEIYCDSNFYLNIYKVVHILMGFFSVFFSGKTISKILQSVKAM